MVTQAVLFLPISNLEATPPRAWRAPESSRTLNYLHDLSIPVKGLIIAFITGIYGVYRYILPEVGDGDEEVFIFFKDFVINNWDLDLLSGIAILKI